jgi:hypothetical protein
MANRHTRFHGALLPQYLVKALAHTLNIFQPAVKRLERAVADVINAGSDLLLTLIRYTHDFRL